MKKYFDQLRPMERRMVVGVAVILFLVLNWVYVYPHFGDWSQLRIRMDNATRKLNNYEAMIIQKPGLEKQVQVYESNGGYVPPVDQGINFIRTIQGQAIESGVAIVNTSRETTHTNDVFFIEQVQNINVSATDEQLVDFLYKLGSGASMIRVRDLELQPDPSHMRLSANIRLVASYQKTPVGGPATNSPKTGTTPPRPALSSVNLPTAKPQ